MTVIFIIAGLILLVALLLFFPMKIRFFFVGARKNGLIEIKFFNWTVFTTQEKADIEDAEVFSATSSAGLNKETMGSPSDEPGDDAGSAVEKEDIVSESENVAFDDAEAGEGNFDDVRLDAAEDTGNDEPDDDEVTFGAKGDTVFEETFTEDIVSEPENVALDESSSGKKKKEKRVLSEKEFLTLMFNPKLNAMVLRMAWRLTKRAWQLFTIRFEHTVVQGIRMEYDEMGTASAIAALLSSQVRFFENWDFQMDWLKEKDLEIRGNILVRFRLFFLMIWSLMTMVFALRVYLWYRKNKKLFIVKPSMFRLVFWRRKIIDLLAAED